MDLNAFLLSNQANSADYWRELVHCFLLAILRAGGPLSKFVLNLI